MGDEKPHLMTFTQHLEELRTRLKYAFYALAAGVIVSYIFSDALFVLLAQPLVRAWGDAGLGAPKIHFANPIEPFFTYLKISLLSGIFVASPVVFYNLWKFVAPGLYKHEKRYVIPFSAISAAFFIGGGCFGYFVVFPYGFSFFLSFAQKNMGAMQDLLGGALSFSAKHSFELKPTLMMGEYFGLVWRLLIGFGAIFELPLLICFLAAAGMVSHTGLWKWNPYFVVLSFVISAVITPPDVITQIFMATPLIILYNFSILFAYVLSRRRAKRAESDAPAE